MTVGPIAPIGPILSAAPVSSIGSVDPAGATAGASGTSFADVLSRGLDHVQSVQDKADDLAVQAATGTLTDVHDYMIAATDASLTTQLTVAIRNKALDAFNDIMRMQA
jgi:flagellar hook-basal body complex protein FliE